MKCYNCGAEIRSDEKFCGKCGRMNPYFAEPAAPVSDADYGRRRKLGAGAVFLIVLACIIAAVAVVTAVAFITAEPDMSKPVSDTVFGGTGTTAPIDDDDGDGNTVSLTRKGDYYVPQADDIDWDDITDVRYQLWLDDGEGYIELGSDNTYSRDDDGELICEPEASWVAMNGYIVPFYAESEDYSLGGKWYTYGYVPAQLNDGDYIEIIVYWSDECPESAIAGYRPSGAVGDDNLLSFTTGDRIQVLCDYYSYDMKFDGTYDWNDPIVYTAEGIVTDYRRVVGDHTVSRFELTDNDGDVFYTESLMNYTEE